MKTISKPTNEQLQRLMNLIALPFVKQTVPGFWDESFLFNRITIFFPVT